MQGFGEPPRAIASFRLRNPYRLCEQFRSDVYDGLCETVFSSITRVFPKSIHAVTYEGFLLKLEVFIFAFTLEQAFQ